MTKQEWDTNLITIKTIITQHRQHCILHLGSITTTAVQASSSSTTTTASDYGDEYPDYGSCDGLFKCEDEDNICIETHLVCDGTNNCPNGKDEENCKCLKSASTL